MTFFLWMALTLHIFAAVTWIGGLAFLSGVAGPVFAYHAEGAAIELAVRRRFAGFMWTSAWALAASAVILVAFYARGEITSLWWTLLAVKLALFAAIVSLSLRLSGVVKRWDGREENAARRIARLTRLALVCGIAAILAATFMALFG